MASITIVGNWKMHGFVTMAHPLVEAVLVAAGIDPQRRAETLRVAEFVALASEQGKGLRPLTPAKAKPLQSIHFWLG